MTPFKKSTLFLLFGLFVFSFQSYAENTEISTPPAPTIAASAYILQDFHTGKVLAENNADVRLAPASLTKIMTVYVVFNELSSGHLHFG